MSYQATVYNLMISCPSDVIREQKVLKDCIIRWNGANTEKNKIALLPLFYKTDVPSVSADSKDKRSQGVVNKYLVTPSDWLIAIFKNRIGSSTGRAISGTVEEIEIFQKDYPERPISIYFYKKTRSLKIKQYKKKCKGIWKEYKDCNELEHEFFIDLSHMVNKNTYIRQKFIDSNRKTEERVQLLLREIANDAKNLVIVSKLTGQELKIETNGCKYVGFEMAFEDLYRKQWIEKKDDKGEMFSLTPLGKQAAEASKSFSFD